MSVSKEALYVYSLRDIQTYNFFLVSLNCELSFLLEAEACKFDLCFLPRISFFSYRRRKLNFKRWLKEDIGEL